MVIDKSVRRTMEKKLIKVHGATKWHFWWNGVGEGWLNFRFQVTRSHLRSFPSSSLSLFHSSFFFSITRTLNDGDLVEAQWVSEENWLVDKSDAIKEGYFLIYI